MCYFYAEIGDYEKVLKYFSDSDKYFEKEIFTEKYKDLANCFITLSYVNLWMNKFDYATEHWQTLTNILLNRKFSIEFIKTKILESRILIATNQW